MSGALTVWTIGHSTRSQDDFLALLAGYGIQAVADVRRFPGSRRHPWFAGQTLAQTLPVAGVEYLWLPQLGVLSNTEIPDERMVRVTALIGGGNGA